MPFVKNEGRNVTLLLKKLQMLLFGLALLGCQRPIKSYLGEEKKSDPQKKETVKKSKERILVPSQIRLKPLTELIDSFLQQGDKIGILRAQAAVKVTERWPDIYVEQLNKTINQNFLNDFSPENKLKVVESYISSIDAFRESQQDGEEAKEGDLLTTSSQWETSVRAGNFLQLTQPLPETPSFAFPAPEIPAGWKIVVTEQPLKGIFQPLTFEYSPADN
jgi:hypothetical protein